MIGIYETKSPPRAAAVAASAGSSDPGQFWSELPRDLQWQILKLLSIDDYIRFGAVCASWHSIVAERRHPPAAALGPQLILSIDDTRWSLQRADRLLNRSSFRPLPEQFRESRPMSCSRGWVAMHNPGKPLTNTFLFNPVTRAVITLPKTDPRATTLLQKLTLSASAASKDCIVAAKWQSWTFNGVAVCRPGDGHWTPLLETDEDSPEEKVQDMTFCGGVLYINYGNHGTLLAATFGGDENLSFSMAEVGRYHFLRRRRLVDLLGGRLVATKPNQMDKLLVFEDGKKEWVNLKEQDEVCVLPAQYMHDCICVPATAECGDGHTNCPTNLTGDHIPVSYKGFHVWFSPSLDAC